MQSLRMLKGATVLAALYFFYLKRTNAALEIQVAKEYHNLFLEHQNLKQLIEQNEEAERQEAWDRRHQLPAIDGSGRNK